MDQAEKDQLANVLDVLNAARKWLATPQVRMCLATGMPPFALLMTAFAVRSKRLPSCALPTPRLRTDLLSSLRPSVLAAAAIAARTYHPAASQWEWAKPSRS